MKTVMTKGSEYALTQEFHCPFCGCEFVSDEFKICSYPKLINPVLGTVQMNFKVTDECPNCGYAIVKEPEGVVDNGD